jgi:pyruvate/2-oxoglutarate dehydrogenase complex dihydrolipoamide dehydrogenase (E3) component
MIEMTEGLDLIMGEARFTGSRSLEVRLNDGNVSHISADTIFINTGLRPAKPPIPGLDGVTSLDNASIMELDTLPEHLMVLGGGYVGLEFGQMFRRFGSQVTIVQQGKQLLEREDPDVAEEVAKILREDGIEVLVETATRRAEGTGDGQIQLTVKTLQEERYLTGSHLLVATGRVPNTEGLGLEAAGVQTDDRGFVQVNERLETDTAGIYAFGDVKGGPALTHIAFDDFRILRANILMGGNATTAGRLVPYTVFIDPQLARVGLSETEALAQGRNIRVANYTQQILGAAILGIEGGEIMAVLQVAMMGNLPYTAIRDGIFTHPTLAELLNDLFMSMDMPMG